MALTVNTNVSALNAITSLNKTNNTLSSSMRRISSGLRVTRAADDAAGLAVAENLDAAKRSLRQASRNANDGISVIQTAEGAAAEVGNILKRMRELAVQSASETLNTTERGYVQSEFSDLRDEVDRIAEVTEFNGISLSDGVNTGLDVQVGIMNTSNDRIEIALGDLDSTALSINSATLSSVVSAQTALTTLDTAIDSVNRYRADFGAAQNRLSSALRNLDTYTENITSAESQIRDADFAFETAELTKYQIMQQAGVSILSQANQVSQAALRLLG